jgi:hypothetical protein
VVLSLPGGAIEPGEDALTATDAEFKNLTSSGFNVLDTNTYPRLLLDC